MSLTSTSHIRPATENDREAISRVHLASVREICREWYSPDQIAAWTHGRGPHTVAIGRHEILVAEMDGSIVGFGELSVPEREICAVYVTPAALGKGVGGGLLRALLDLAREKGIDTLGLCSTVGAVAFYEHFGFERLRETTYTVRPDVHLPCFEMRSRQKTDGGATPT